MPKKKTGQTYIPEVGRRPRGMPPNDVIKTEIARMGLTEEDADAIIDSWLGNGFRTKNGPVNSWTAVLRTWKREKWFPSQKKGQKDRSAKTDWSKYQ